MTKKKNDNGSVVIPLTEEDLSYPKEFIDKVGGPENARTLLLEIMSRYFDWEYFYPETLESLGIIKGEADALIN